MKKEHKKIVEYISTFLNKYPDQRFGQAIFNLKINEFLEEEDCMNPKYQLRDIYGDSDEEILHRVESQTEWLKKQSNDQ
ncbi:hypothetical protein [Aquimarina sp. 2304DJ70-9]|uniref:hypothetical protein n=1 Tax=Aquimarina penaris TaxID=3231044 RepID=UPI0034635F99